MDHRAIEQAQRINAIGHDVLRYVGGVISPEMEMPKLLWLKENATEDLDARRAILRPSGLSDVPRDRQRHAIALHDGVQVDLPRQGGALGRRVSGERRSRRSRAEEHARIGTSVRPMGEQRRRARRAGGQELGLEAGTPVGVGIIDAHAGGLGLLGAPLDGAAPTKRRSNGASR